MIHFNVPPTPDTTEFSLGTVQHVNLVGVYEAGGELKTPLFDEQRQRKGADFIAFLGESCGSVIRANGGLGDSEILDEMVDKYTEALTGDWNNEQAIKVFREKFLTGAVEEGIYSAGSTKQGWVAV
jgi:hypothetical protein